MILGKRIKNHERNTIMTRLDTQHLPTALHRRSGGSALSLFSRVYDIWRQRQVLRKLDIDALNDIGISRKDAFAEARRPIWDVPATWRD